MLVFRYIKPLVQKLYSRSLHDRDRYRLSITFSLRYLIGITLIYCSVSCNKLVEVPPPTNSITTAQVFKDSSDANSALLGIYASLINTGNPSFTSGAITLDCGISADELINFQNTPDLVQLYLNKVQPTNGEINLSLWKKAYATIYQSNAAIEGISNSKGISEVTKNHLLGEARFIRAFCYFYLTNLFGNVPYISSSNWKLTSLASPAQQSEIYKNIIADLEFSQANLPSDYSMSNGERTRANQAAATALLARVYLYQRNWAGADSAASAIINSGNYELNTDLNNVFLANSTETILQWSINPTNSNIANMTPEGRSILPSNANTFPKFFLSPQLLNSFDLGDQRKNVWIGSSKYSGKTYFYPHKYKIGVGQAKPNGTASEYYMVLRYAEQFLIRAEAELNGSGLGLNGAVGDLNFIRNRAGLPDYNGSLNRDSIFNSVMHERQVEFFSEWGHRWFDLKRTGEIDGVMSLVTPQKNGGGSWQSFKQLYPFPLSQLLLDPNLKQNKGY